MPTSRTSFPLRFHDDMTMDVLRVVAKAREISVNALIEEMVARGLPREIEIIEHGLVGTLEALQGYKRSFEDDWQTFAEAEAQEDPLQARQVEHVEDPLGVNAIFA